jgi:hypothetical protein
VFRDEDGSIIDTQLDLFDEDVGGDLFEDGDDDDDNELVEIDVESRQ